MINKYLYHATYKPLLPQIKENGLDNTNVDLTWSDSEIGVVYLATDAELAASFAESRYNIPEEWLDEIVILKIDTSVLDKTNLQLDTQIIDNTGYSYEYHGIIPWSAVKGIIVYE